MKGKNMHHLPGSSVLRCDTKPGADTQKSLNCMVSSGSKLFVTLTKETNQLKDYMMKCIVCCLIQEFFSQHLFCLLKKILLRFVLLQIYRALIYFFGKLASLPILSSAKVNAFDELKQKQPSQAVILRSDTNNKEVLERKRTVSTVKIEDRIINEPLQHVVLEVLVPILYNSPLERYSIVDVGAVEMQLCYKQFSYHSFNTLYKTTESKKVLIDRDEDITKEKVKNLEHFPCTETTLTKSRDEDITKEKIKNLDLAESRETVLTKSNYLKACLVETSEGHSSFVHWQTGNTVKSCNINSKLNVVDIKNAISQAASNANVSRNAENVKNSDSERVTLKQSLEKAKKKSSRDGRVVQSKDDDGLDVIRDLTELSVTESTQPQRMLTVCMIPEVPTKCGAQLRNGYDSRLEADGHHGIYETTIPEQTTEIVEPQQTKGAGNMVSTDFPTIDSVLQEMANGREVGPKISMRFELLRLCTLRNFPKDNKPYIIRLAAAGFYYAADGDEVICYSCGIRKSNWTAECNPMATHKRLSPHCSFFNRNAEVNIPVPSEVQSEGRDRFANLRELLQDPGPNRGNDIPSYARNDTASTNITVYDTSPKHPHYAVKQVRLNSYVGWPEDSPQTPEVLAEAGFYYAGMGDCVRCYHCGTGLRHWAIDDNPWIEHGRWTLDNPCYYLIKVKGEEFQSLIRMAVEITDSQPQIGNPNQSQGESGNTPSQGESGKKSDKKQGTNKKGGSKHSKKQKGKPSSEKMQLKEENEKLRKQTLCKVCEERDVCVVFLPCGHLVTCAECAPTLSICPTCKGAVKGTVKTYMS